MSTLFSEDVQVQTMPNILWRGDGVDFGQMLVGSLVPWCRASEEGVVARSPHIGDELDERIEG